MTEDLVVHERTLLGALDSFLGTVVRTRPQLAAAYGEHLEDFAARWLASSYPNEIDAVAPHWISAYLASSLDRSTAEAAIRDFFSWAVLQNLVPEHPMAPRKTWTGSGMLHE
jgi:hypothetical protein